MIKNCQYSPMVKFLTHRVSLIPSHGHFLTEMNILREYHCARNLIKLMNCTRYPLPCQQVLQKYALLPSSKSNCQCKRGADWGELTALKIFYYFFNCNCGQHSQSFSCFWPKLITGILHLTHTFRLHTVGWGLNNQLICACLFVCWCSTKNVLN